MINEAAYKEILSHDGVSAAQAYLVMHEGMTPADAADFMVSGEPTKEMENIPVYYCEEHNLLTSPDACNLKHANNTTIWGKVKSYFGMV